MCIRDSCLRDQFGTKPFYYYETEDGELLYGTMIRDIIDRPGFKKELNEEMLQLYLSLTYVAGENTFFRGLKKLLPGRYLIWQDGKLEIHRYWKPEFHPDESKTLEDWADEIHNTLKEIITLLCAFARNACRTWGTSPAFRRRTSSSLTSLWMASATGA